MHGVVSLVYSCSKKLESFVMLLVFVFPSELDSGTEEEEEEEEESTLSGQVRALLCAHYLVAFILLPVVTC